MELNDRATSYSRAVTLESPLSVAATCPGARVSKMIHHATQRHASGVADPGPHPDHIAHHLGKLIERFDKDGDGVIDSDELENLEKYLEGNKKKQQRLSVMLGVAVLGLVLSVAVNFGMTTLAVNAAQNQKNNGTTVVDSKTGEQLTMSTSTTNVMMGMMVPLVQNDPATMIAAAPEGIILIDVYGASGPHALSLRTTSMSYYPPSTVRIKTLSGEEVQLDGSTNGTVTRADGTTFRFCAACAPIQLKSVIKTASYDAALAAFESEVAATVAGSDCDPAMTTEERDARQNGQRQVATVLGAGFRSTLGQQPAVCAEIEAATSQPNRSRRAGSAQNC